jgi:hypothetical protein
VTTAAIPVLTWWGGGRHAALRAPLPWQLALLRGLIAAVLPQHVGLTGVAVGHPTEHEHQVGQAVKVNTRGLTDLLRRGQRNQGAFGAAADGARHVRQTGRTATTRKNELLQWWQVAVEVLDQRLEARDLRAGDADAAGDAHLATQVEQVVLHTGEGIADIGPKALGQEQANARIEFVDIAQRGDAQAVFGNAAAIAQAGFTGIAGACGYF